MENLKWGILGLGEIAGEFAKAMKPIGKIYAAASNTPKKLKEFLDTYEVSKGYGSYEELLEDPYVDIVYIATINSLHYKNIIDSLNHGKHVLCEKAIWPNLNDMKAAYALAKEKGLILAEAMTIYHMPLYRKIQEIINEGRIGKLIYVHADFGSLKDYSPEKRYFSKEQGGGAMLDIGTYALSFVTNFLTPPFKSLNYIVDNYPTGVDSRWSIAFKSSDEVMVNVNLSFLGKLPKQGVIAGEKGYITVMNYPRAHSAEITYASGEKEAINSGESSLALGYEIKAMEQAVREGNENLMFTEKTLGVVELMDALMAGAGYILK